MRYSRSLFLSLICGLACQAAFAAPAEAPVSIVFQNGKSIPMTSLGLQGDKFVVMKQAEGFTVNQTLPLTLVDHVYGIRPKAINQGVALILIGNAKDAQKLLEPIVAAYRSTAKFPGNFWVEAARALLLAQAINGNTAACEALGKEISDATPEAGIDPFVQLGKALMMPPLTTSFEDRETAFRDLTADHLPATVCAYASFFRGRVLAGEKDEKRKAEALDAYLSVSCLFPSGGMILNAAAELQAADLLAAQSKREEAIELLNSAQQSSGGTILAAEAKKRLESLK